MITSGLGRGGSELQFLQVATGLVDRGWDVTAISMQTAGPYEDLLASRGVAVRVCAVGRVPSPWSLLRLFHEVGEARSPLVLTQAFRANLWGRLAAISLGQTVIASVRATYRYLPTAYFPLERMLARGTAAVVTPSRATTAFLAECVGVPVRKIVTIPNGVDTDTFTPERNGLTFRERWQLENSFVVLGAGRLVEQKNFGALLRAYCAFARGASNTALVIAGSGPEAGSLRAEASALGVACRFVGDLDREQMADAMAAADCVCLMSHFEGMPNVALEAMASGRPVVATRVDGIPELIDDGVHGVLVEDNDIEAVSAALLRMLRLPDWRAELGKAGRKKVIDQFSIPTNLASHERLLEAVS